MSRNWLLPGSSITLVLACFGALVASCSDDETAGGGCSGSCARGWSVCQTDLTNQGTTETDFENQCLNQCRSAASSNARSFGTALACLNQAQDCNAARQCDTFGGLFGFPSSGGFPNFGTGGFPGDGGFVGNGGAAGFFETGGTLGTGGSPGCSDGCFYAKNGLCDDGGPNSVTSRCALATDCADCGVRATGSGGGFGTGGVGGTGGIGGAGGAGTGGMPGCSDTCFYAHNFQCEDGGPSSISSLCAFGTDCSDCGVRVATGGSAGTGGSAPDGGLTLCADTCIYEQNGSCDDGGQGSISGKCAYGTDCTDCGARPFASNGAAGSPVTICANTCPSSNNARCDADGTVCNPGTDCSDCGALVPSGLALCTDACSFSNDGTCDDGGFGSGSSLCATGTDCSDCGPR